jgi:hypothetical protein
LLHLLPESEWDYPYNVQSIVMKCGANSSEGVLI